MHVLAGRQFTWQDDGNSKRVVVVSESLARQLFGAANAVGRHIRVGLDPELQDLEIAGVVNSASLWKLQSHEPPAFFLPLLQQEKYDSELVNLRVDGDPMAAASAARKILASLGKQYALSIETLPHRMDRILISERIIAVLSDFFGAVALLLAAIGLYGVLALSVTARTSEIGVRLALGAQRRDVVELILRQVLLTTIIGFAAGVPLTLAGSRFIQGMIFGVPAQDPATLLLAASVLLIAAFVAGYLPARRAAHIDPMEALRSN
jgi:ABC-type lipoprotein release transport system permease subunit